MFGFADVRAAVGARHIGYLTLVEAAARLGTTFYVCRALVGTGHVGSAGQGAPHGRRARDGLVEPAAVDAFLAEHEGAFELAARLGTHARVLLPRLARHGIEPAIAKADVGKAFFHRRQVAGIERVLGRAGGIK